MEIKITDPCKSWWPGDKRVEPYMMAVRQALSKFLDLGPNT